MAVAKVSSVNVRAWAGVGALALLGAALWAYVFMTAFPHGRVQPRDRFEAAVVGATPAEVRARLGDPDEVVGEVIWHYRGRTRDAQTGKADAGAWLWFRDGRVRDVTYTAGP
jgi:hypothetical protein